MEVTNLSLDNSTMNSLIEYNHTENNYDQIGDELMFIFDGVALPIIALFGTIGNIVSIIVLNRPSMRKPSSMNYVLIGLTSCDLLFAIAMFFFRSVGQQYAQFTEFAEDWQYGFELIFYPLSFLFWIGSHFFTVLITIERYIAVCHPLKAASLCSGRRAKWASVMTIVTSIIISMPSFFDPLFVNAGEEIAHSYDLYYTTYFTIIVGNVIPFGIIIVLNIAIYLAIRNSKAMQNSCQRKQVKDDDEDDELRSLALLLFAIIITFLTTNLFQLAADIAICGFDAKNTFFVKIILAPRHFMETLNSCVNFVFYCAFGKKFRNELCLLISAGVSTKKRRLSVACTTITESDC